jgi:hypothetical protein
MRLIIACLLFFCVKAIAAENVVDYKSPEAMGRGDSVISWSNNNLTNLFENPSFDIINVGIDLSNNAVPLISHIPNVKNGDVYQELSPYFGNSYNAQGFAAPVISYKGFTLVPAFYSGLGSATIRNPVFSNADAYYYYDVGAALGKAIHVTDSLSVGASIVYSKRTAELDSANLINLFRLPQPTNVSGESLSFNLGANYQMKDPYETTFGVSWVNIGSPQYWQSTSVMDEDSISDLYEEIGFGVSSHFFPVLYFSDKVKWSIEVHNISDSRYSAVQKLTAGLQYSLLSWLKLDAGLYDESPSCGVEIQTRIISVDFSSYEEDSGLGYGAKNRHFNFGFKLGFE